MSVRKLAPETPATNIVRYVKGLELTDLIARQGLLNLSRTQIAEGHCGTIGADDGVCTDLGWPCPLHTRAKTVTYQLPTDAAAAVAIDAVAPGFRDVRPSLAKAAAKMTGLFDTSAPFEVEPTEIDPDQQWNPRSIITKTQLAERYAAFGESGGSDADILLYRHDKPGLGYRWRLVGGNISFLAAFARFQEGDARFARLWCREVQGDQKKAAFVASRNNYAQQQLSSYDKAHDLAQKRAEFGYASTEQLVADCVAAGWNISVSTADNLMSATRQCIPEVLEAWKYSGVPLEEKPDQVKTLVARNVDVGDADSVRKFLERDIDVNDMTVLWLKSKPKDIQRQIWARLRNGEHWKAIKSQLEAARVPTPAKFRGGTFVARKPKQYEERLTDALGQIDRAELGPVAAAAVDVVVEYVLTSKSGDVAAEIRARLAQLTSKDARVAGVTRFIAERCVRRSTVTPSSRLSDAYAKWAREQKLRPISPNELAAQLTRLGLESTKGHGGVRGWRGIELVGHGVR